MSDVIRRTYKRYLARRRAARADLIQRIAVELDAKLREVKRKQMSAEPGSVEPR